MSSRHNRIALFGSLGLMCFSSLSCATKRFLRDAVAPVQNQLDSTNSHVSGIEKQVAANHEAIGDLDRTVATTSEKAEEAQRKAQEAADAAARANTAAAEAARLAEAANLAALKVQQDLDRARQNIDTFRQVATEQIFFGINQSALNKNETEKLDMLIQKLHELKAYIVEVKGFADSTGSAASNLKLSQERTDAVVHYLSVDRSVPPSSIRQFGAGSSFPGADNRTAAARKSNRRVDITVFVRDVANQETPNRSAQ